MSRTPQGAAPAGPRRQDTARRPLAGREVRGAAVGRGVLLTQRRVVDFGLAGATRCRLR
ncbi:hypothetical protein [Streptomyces xiamenensis]|uniref:hypothetical protein n=1 Tax=Streptomyces xiamenensis TaxID=408015 RepID=UPI0037CF408F